MTDTTSPKATSPKATSPETTSPETTSPETTSPGGPATPSPLAGTRPRWAGPWMAGIWLFFLLNPLGEGWKERHQVSGVIGMAATVAFSVVYMSMWFRARLPLGEGDRERLMARELPLRSSLPYLLGQVALGATMVVTLGEPGIACVVYIAVSCVMALPMAAAGAAVLTLIVLSLASEALPGWGNQVGTAFGVLAASLAIFGMRTVMARNIELFGAQQENTRLAIDGERNRFARDLHDILGHSLTVITVKAELAQRLLDIDPERARTELADLERLSRDALADVRKAVEGYRELTLPGELARARAALAAAEIDPLLPQSTDEVPGELRELFAWAVREGVTNVIRHSGAKRCQIVLTPSSAEIRDDGRGPASEGPAGSGLLGLRERATAVGATVVTQALEPGFSLQVVR